MWNVQVLHGDIVVYAHKQQTPMHTHTSVNTTPMHNRTSFNTTHTTYLPHLPPPPTPTTYLEHISQHQTQCHQKGTCGSGMTHQFIPECLLQSRHLTQVYQGGIQFLSRQSSSHEECAYNITILKTLWGWIEVRGWVERRGVGYEGGLTHILMGTNQGHMHGDTYTCMYTHWHIHTCCQIHPQYRYSHNTPTHIHLVHQGRYHHPRHHHRQHLSTKYHYHQ